MVPQQNIYIAPVDQKLPSLHYNCILEKIQYVLLDKQTKPKHKDENKKDALWKPVKYKNTLDKHLHIKVMIFMKQQKLNKLIHISRNNEFLGVYCHLFLNFIMWKLSPTMHLIFCHIAYIQIFCTQILWRMLYPKSLSSRPPNYQPKVKDIIMVQFFNLITPLYLHHSQTVDKTDKTVLWGEQVWYFKWTASIDFFKDAFFKGHSYQDLRLLMFFCCIFTLNNLNLNNLGILSNTNKL